MGGNNKVSERRKIYVLPNTKRCIVKLPKIKCLPGSQNSSKAFVNLPGVAKNEKSSSNLRDGKERHLKFIEIHPGTENIACPKDLSKENKKGECNQKYSVNDQQNSRSQMPLVINTTSDSSSWENIDNIPLPKIAKCLIPLQRIKIENNLTSRNESQGGQLPTHGNNFRRYKMKMDSGNISFTLAEDRASDLKQEEKENIGEQSRFGSLFKNRSKPNSGVRRSRRKINRRKNEPSDLGYLMDAKHQDAYYFDAENIKDENDVTADVIQKIIKDGRAAIVKYKHQVPKKKIRKNTTSQLFRRINKYLQKSRNDLVQSFKSRTKNEDKVAGDIVVSDSRDFPGKEMHDFQHLEDSDNMNESIVEPDGNDKIIETVPSEIIDKNDALNDDLMNKSKNSIASLNPAKAIKVLEVIYLPNRATILPSSAPLKEMPPAESPISETTYTTGLDITHGNYFDFLAKLEEGENTKGGDSILPERSEVEEQSNLTGDANKKNLLEADIHEETGDDEDDEGVNDSLFPDVNVTPCFDKMVQRKTYSRTPKHRDRRTRYFILFSDKVKESKKDESVLEEGSTQSITEPNFERTVEKIAEERSIREGSEELNEKENVKPEPTKHSKSRKKRRLDYGTIETPRSSKHIKFGSRNKSFESSKIKGRLLRL